MENNFVHHASLEKPAQNLSQTRAPLPTYCCFNQGFAYMILAWVDRMGQSLNTAPFSRSVKSVLRTFGVQTNRFYVTRACPFHKKDCSILWRYGFTGCLFCRWPTQNQQTGPSQIGHQIPQARARHCRSSWRFRLVCPMAWHSSWVECTRTGMCRTSWRQIGGWLTTLPTSGTTVGWNVPWRGRRDGVQQAR